MQKRRALKLLRAQHEMLDPYPGDMLHWRETTVAYLERVMDPVHGKKQLDDFRFFKLEAVSDDGSWFQSDEDAIERNRSGLTMRLGLCIDLVEKFGPHKTVRHNWFTQHPVAMAGLCITVFIATGGAFYKLGIDTASNRIQGLSQQLTSARDSMSVAIVAKEVAQKEARAEAERARSEDLKPDTVH